MSTRLIKLGGGAFCLLALITLSNLSAAQTYCPNAATGNADVLTWHNDTNRTGWQCNEPYLTQSNVTPNSNSFGLIARWSVQGSVYAQPLAVANPCTVQGCDPDYILVATEDDWLYAYSPPSKSSPSGALAWNPVDLATLINSNYTPVNCNTSGNNPPSLCTAGGGTPIFNPDNYIGVTGTPVIDPSTYTLYVVAAVCTNCPVTEGTASIAYYLYAIDYTNGNLIAAQQVGYNNNTGQYISVTGREPTQMENKCQNPPVYANNTTITFQPGYALQRQALLLQTNGTNKIVYVTFSDFPEIYQDNGWIFGYYLNTNGTFTQYLAQAPTAFSGEGGVWGSGAGPAADATNGTGSQAFSDGIYLAIGNGSFDAYIKTQPPNYSGSYQDYGDSLIRLDASNNYWPPHDYYTPGNVFTYGNSNQNNNCPSGPSPGICACDEDFGSGGVMVLPSGYTYTCNPNTQSCGTPNPCPAPGCNVVVSADKQSNIYVENQVNLGQYGGTNINDNLELVTTPTPTLDGYQGYWASPAYWYDGNTNWMFYSATDTTKTAVPWPLLGYMLATSGSIPSNSAPFLQNGNAKSWNTYTVAGEPVGPVEFCDKAPTPPVSSNFTSNGTVDPTTGIVWVIENPNGNNPNPKPPAPNNCNGTGIAKARLHAICATTSAQASSRCANNSGELIELYNSNDNVVHTAVGAYVPFSTPTVFGGYVYMGTQSYVNVFGLCSGGTCPLD
ncbi:MAG TPA: hypothetical protein VF753_07985 [Terriglobales bacterium]